MAPLVKKLQEMPEEFQTVVCVTGQHREMLDQVLRLFDITPEYDLNIMKPNQDLYDITSRILLGMRDVLKEVQPDVVLVHGDTSTTFVTALACFYKQIPIGHVEAGLRTYNIYSPYPEEMNRQMVDRMTDIQLTEENRIPCPELTGKALHDHANRLFQMYSGDALDVKMRFHKSLLNVVIDRFGKDTMLIPDGEEHFNFTVKVAISPMFLSWVIGFGAKAKILYPQSVADACKELCMEAMSQYSD